MTRSVLFFVSDYTWTGEKGGGILITTVDEREKKINACFKDRKS